MSQSEVALGLAVPPLTPHAISVSLPKWIDNVDYELGTKRVADSMVNGYPRFFIHLSIRKLEEVCMQKFGKPGESCMLFPTLRNAEHCRAFIQDRSSQDGNTIKPRLVVFMICPEDRDDELASEHPTKSSCVELHIALYPSDAGSYAKQFWQHTGTGVSSRLAEHCLSSLPTAKTTEAPAPRVFGKVLNKHYSTKSSTSPIEQLKPTPASHPNSEHFTQDHNVYLEERYGRNLPISAAESAKRALRRRISGVLSDDSSPEAGSEDLELVPSKRGVSGLTENDVYLYQTGMTAIWSAHVLARSTLPDGKSVCFGFPYTDTLKVLEKWGPGCHFLGRGLDSDIDELEKILKEEQARNPSKPPILALFTEFPSNPLLRSADLSRLRSLADEYDFLIVVDETIGNFMNVGILKYADIVVSSLTKVFSGASNVMGGSLVLNPEGRHYNALKKQMDASYEDFYFEQDAVFMERNSRDFQQRIKTIDRNAEAVCDFLYQNSVAGGKPNAVIKEVFYPKFTCRDHYEKCRNKKGGYEGGFGGLFSLTCTSDAISRVFFDELGCYKGPSLGTNFTLACPFTILAHFAELDWAAQFDVEAGLVRVSVGLEDTASLLEVFGKALKLAETFAANERQT